eukprot:6412726-Amphidinium_carterae.1
MKRWYGQACLIKTDVVSAFDNVSWRSIVEALEDTGLPPPFIDVLIQSQMAGYELHWEKQVQQTIWVPTSGVRQGCKLGPVLFRLVLEFALKHVSADWKWAPAPVTEGCPCIGVELYGPSQNGNRLHLLVFADDIFCLVANWSVATTALLQIRSALTKHNLDISAEKTEIVCTSGPLTLPSQSIWPQQKIGGASDQMNVLGAGFTLADGFNDALPQRISKCMRTWYVHKQVYTANALPLANRYQAACSSCQGSLFWGLVVAAPKRQLLQKLDTQALAIARLTANCRRNGMPIDEYNKSTATFLRDKLPKTALSWSKQLLRQQ